MQKVISAHSRTCLHLPLQKGKIILDPKLLFYLCNTETARETVYSSTMGTQLHALPYCTIFVPFMVCGSQPTELNS